MSKRQFCTHSADETVALGRLISNFLEAGQMVILRGDLGAGKTTLVKGIAEGFHAALQEDVTSPTFTLVHEYRGPEVTLFHIDLYRIDTEWGKKFESIVEESGTEIALERTGETERVIILRDNQ
jgi:tRNA threonylcarbamoyladenosine biosynthesis protein TsaE